MVSLIFEWLGPILATPLGSDKLTSNDLPRPSEIHQGLGPYGPGCSYATGVDPVEVVHASFRTRSVLKFSFNSCKYCMMLVTSVSVVVRSDEVVFTVVVVLWRLCSCVSKPGMC